MVLDSMKPFKIPNDISWVGVGLGGNRRPLEIETIYFKKQFEIESVPKKAEINISANERYILYINETEIIRGPLRHDHKHQYIDTVDIAPYLIPGSNIITVKVISFVPLEATNSDMSNFGPMWAMSNSAGPLLLVHGEIDPDISTGRTEWLYANDNAIKWIFQPSVHWMGCTEYVDAKKLPVSDDYNPAVSLLNNIMNYGEIPSLYLYERPIKYLMRKPIGTIGEEVTIKENTKTEILLDFKKLTTSYIYLKTKGGKNSKIALFYSEAFTKLENGRRYKEDRNDTTGELFGFEDVYIPTGVGEIYSPSLFRTFRYIKLTIETKDSPITIYPIDCIETRYPLENNIKFEAESWVKDVWDISLRTLELCMHETYEDCPFYEQLQYTMDTRLQMLFTYLLGNSTDMQKKTIHDFHTSILPEGIMLSRFPSRKPLVIPVFSLHWIFMLEDYYNETGDKSLLERYRPTMEQILAWFKRHTGETGLIEHLGYWDFADWTEEWADIAGVPRAALEGPSTIQNLTYAYALSIGAKIMDILGIHCIADKYKSEREYILKRVNTLCWCEEKKLFKEGPNFNQYSQQSGVWAVLNKLVTGDRAKDLMTKTLEDKTLVQCSFVWQFYMFRALETAGMYDKTEKLWDMWKILIDWNLSTVPEIPGKYSRSDCHAWGSLILHELPRKFLGISPLEPGYTSIQIKPIALYINEISGSVPTPHGDVSIKWSNNNQFKISGFTPVPAVLIMPNGEEINVLGEFALSV